MSDKNARPLLTFKVVSKSLGKGPVHVNLSADVRSNVIGGHAVYGKRKKPVSIKSDRPWKELNQSLKIGDSIVITTDRRKVTVAAVSLELVQFSIDNGDSGEVSVQMDPVTAGVILGGIGAAVALAGIAAAAFVAVKAMENDVGVDVGMQHGPDGTNFNVSVGDGRDDDDDDDGGDDDGGGDDGGGGDGGSR